MELVEKRGEFAVRGGILDVFPPLSPSSPLSPPTRTRRSPRPPMGALPCLSP
ncbi:hypothetical protein HUT05_30675 [Streptomyces chartreusis]|uniref:Uncharacterized protein n=1 Tax=Streptomyces chartreusis TaxID=1969 RepID=A0A7H8TE60_STRCX|nr:hypothetical protein HUT05_30675 [Streptomyces chartreusis]